jgi:dihydrolipoamide dehydrogenase
MGISVSDVSLDLKKLRAWKDASIERLEQGIVTLCRKNGVEVLAGTARFESSDQILVAGAHGTRRVRFRNALLATGSEVAQLPVLKDVPQFVWTAEDALELQEIPKQLVIIGGGYIAAEMVNVYAKLGSNVFIVERSDRFLEHMDADAARVVSDGFKDLGVHLFLDAQVKSAKKKGQKLQLELLVSGKVEEVFCDRVLVAIGRHAHGPELGLENTRVQLDDHGFVRINGKCQTSDERIYAVGDCTGGPMLAHRAFRMGKVAAEAIAGEASAFDNVTVPSVVFSDPEVAVAGIGEDEAKKRGLDVVIGKFPFSALGRAVSGDATEGFVKVIADRGSQVILGVVMAGGHVSEFLGEATLAVECGLQLDDVAVTIHPHPTFSEALSEACEQALGKAIHTGNKK